MILPRGPLWTEIQRTNTKNTLTCWLRKSWRWLQGHGFNFTCHKLCSIDKGNNSKRSFDTPKHKASFMNSLIHQELTYNSVWTAINASFQTKIHHKRFAYTLEIGKNKKIHMFWCSESGMNGLRVIPIDFTPFFISNFTNFDYRFFGFLECKKHFLEPLGIQSTLLIFHSQSSTRIPLKLRLKNPRKSPFKTANK